MIKQQVAAPIGRNPQMHPETIRINPNIATKRTSPKPPKKLAVVRVFSAGVRRSDNR